jgi:Rrf2 family nitric oxide-sensitive transcriptional repressor
MRMTFHTDYALRMLIYAAVRGDRASTVSEVAAAYGLSRNHLLKVALRLRRIGVIETARGRTGGIRIAVALETIRIGSLVRSVEEDSSLVECMRGGGEDCAISPVCTLTGMFCKALNAYLAVLDRYTLANIVRRPAPLKSLLGIDARAA